MSLMAKSEGGGGGFTPVPEGTHIAVCTMVVDLGMQRSNFQGDEKIQQKVCIGWEIPNELVTINDEQVPAKISKTYTVSLHEKANLRKDLVAWRGRQFTDEELDGFDLKNILAKTCQINVTHWENNGKSGAQVSSVAGFPKGMEAPFAKSKPISYEIGDSPDVFNALPEWLQKKINERVREDEPEVSGDEGSLSEDLNDSVPF